MDSAVRTEAGLLYSRFRPDQVSALKMEDTAARLTGLRSQRSSQCLEEIASLRSRGIGEHISLPQLVVCGDQSAGKSSVLEGITGLPFPRQDGICTRFATEIMLMHTEGQMHMQAEIIPSQFRTESAKDDLAAYKRTIADFSELPTVITEAGRRMGVRGFGDSELGTTFAQDVLPIKVMRPPGLHLTVVDLPGLIAVVNEQQTEDDVQAVHSLVDSYVENSRTIILAVVQANNDIANQGIIQKSKRHDRRGERTIGIITKPDLLNTGTEGRIAALARNQETTRLKLGFFLLKNPSPSDLAAGYSYSDREKYEQDYFAASPWREENLDVSRTGVTPLREFLQRLLDQHIERELPKVRDEISLLISKTAEDLAALGEARPTPGHMRIFLSRVAMQFHRLVTAALHGDYHGVDAVFFETTDEAADHIRLRALVHNLNTDFAHEMREHGQTMIVVSDADSESDGLESASEDLPGIPHRVSREEMNAFVMKVCFEPTYTLLCLTDLGSCIGKLVAGSCQETTTMSFSRSCSTTSPKAGRPSQKTTLQMSSRRSRRSWMMRCSTSALTTRCRQRCGSASAIYWMRAGNRRVKSWTSSATINPSSQSLTIITTRIISRMREGPPRAIG